MLSSTAMMSPGLNTAVVLSSNPFGLLAVHHDGVSENMPTSDAKPKEPKSRKSKKSEKARGPRESHEPHAAAGLEIAAAPDRREVDGRLWNSWRWIPRSVVGYTATCKAEYLVVEKMEGGRDKKVEPKWNSWTCGFTPCGHRNRGGKVCQVCFFGRPEVDVIYSCRGRSCRAAGRNLQFATVEALLTHLERPVDDNGEGFERVTCGHCGDTVWSGRLREHLAADHPLKASKPKSTSAHAARLHTHGYNSKKSIAVKSDARPTYDSLFPALGL